MTAIALDNTAIASFGVLFNHVSGVSEQHPWLDQLNGLVKAFSRRFDNSDSVWVGLCLVAHIVRLIQVSVEAAVVQSNVNIHDVAIFQRSLIRNTMANGLVNRSAH